MEETKPRDSNFLATSILIAAVMISGSIIYVVRSGKAPQQSEAVSPGSQVAAVNSEAAFQLSERDVILGEPSAPVALIEYGDYQCPFCGIFFEEVEPLLREEYIKTGKVKMVFRNLAFLGPESRAAAEAAECAKDQNKFWAYHDELYRVGIADGEEHNGNLTEELFAKIAGQLGLDIEAFSACYSSRKYSQKIADETDAAQELGINATPTTFINGRVVRGAVPYARFKEVIDSFLKEG